MESNSVQWVGSPCGLHGPYIFYKAFQFHLEGRPRILSLGDFFFVRCKPEDPMCIAELQLLWEERTSRQLLSSSKLYFLPEDTPQGRSSDHGEDEVIAASEKVTVKLEDLAKWAQADCSKWKRGLRVEALRPAELGKNGQKEALTRFRQSTHNSGLNFKDILKEKADLGEDNEDSNVLILSYPQYCRYRSMLKRIQDKPTAILTDQFVLALGGIAVISKNPQILYCRDTFDHPTLTENESICDEFAPNLKGRPRKKKPCPQRRDSLNGIKDSNNNCDSKAVAKVKCEAKLPLSKTKNNNSNCKRGSSEFKSKVSIGEDCRTDEQAFLVALYKYMKERKTPIERIPYLGFKQINLWTMFQAAQKLGGYETITARRQWKHIYDELGGNPGSTSAATCTRRHYERLILPYERFIKGEEDKPLPPVKPRKQDNVPQESESKTKLSGTKRIKNESQKSKKERDNAQKSQDAPEVSSEQEKDQECPDEKTLSELSVVDEMKPSVEGHQPPAPDEAEGTPLEKAEPNETNSYTEEVKEEVPPEDSFSSTLVPSDEEAVLDSTASKLSSPPEDLDEPKQEPGAQRFANYLESDAHEIPFNNFSSVELSSQNEIADNKLPEMADYIANCTVKVDQLGNEDIHNALKQSPKVLVVQNFDMFKEKEPLGSINGDPGFSYTPLLYSKGNPGIMSPLAKKKLLSQVSGANLSCSYPYGSPPPLISKKKLSSREEQSLSMPQAPHAPAMEATAISRPSVIQHVQSFKPKNSEERKSVNETYRHELLLKKVDSESCDFTKQHLTTLAESYALKSEIQDMKEKRGLHHSHMPTFLTDFYSSPHLHSLYRHTEHHLNNEQTSKYLLRDMYRKSENISMFPQHKHPDKRNLCYHPLLHQQEKKTPLEALADDQPTDLSLPKSSHKQTAKGLGSGLLHASAGQPESKNIPPFQTLSGQPLGVDCNPKACRVSPMTILAPKKQHSEPFLRSGKPQNLRKMEGMSHPILSHKTNIQPVGAARPLKRGLEDLDKAVSEKKIRAVSPLRLPKEAPTKDKGLEPEADGGKPVHGLPSSSMLEGHKFPLSSPIFTGLYPGTLCSGLSNRIPAGYSHPLQYLKNQTVLSPLMQPLALHSFMVQRQFLTSPGSSQQLYRHLAAATPVGSSYGDLLHNNIYPLAAINPQAAFPPSQLSSVHPSTKL